MLGIGALALGIVCGWLTVLVGRAALLPAAAFAGLLIAGCWLAAPGAGMPILAGAAAGAAAHAGWRIHLAGLAGDRGEGDSGDG